MSKINNKINVDGVEYDLPGVEVIANPTLAGTEDDLESIQIGNTKFKLASGGGSGSGSGNYFIPVAQISAIQNLENQTVNLSALKTLMTTLGIDLTASISQMAQPFIYINIGYAPLLEIFCDTTACSGQITVSIGENSLSIEVQSLNITFGDLIDLLIANDNSEQSYYTFFLNGSLEYCLTTFFISIGDYYYSCEFGGITDIAEASLAQIQSLVVEEE